MTQYAIYFNQQWVGDHPAEWFQSRVEPSTAVVAEMEAAGVLVFAGGLEEDLADAFSADGTSGTMSQQAARGCMTPNSLALECRIGPLLFVA